MLRAYHRLYVSGFFVLLITVDGYSIVIMDTKLRWRAPVRYEY